MMGTEECLYQLHSEFRNLSNEDSAYCPSYIEMCAQGTFRKIRRAILQLQERVRGVGGLGSRAFVNCLQTKALDK